MSGLIDISKIKIQRTIAIYGMIVFAFFTLLNLFFFSNLIAVVNFSAGLILLGVYILIQLKKYFSSTILLFGSFPAILLFFDILLGNVGASFYHFSVIVLASFIIKNNKLFAAIALYVIFCFSIFYLINFPGIYPEIGRTLIKFNIIGSVICIAIVSVVYKNESHRQFIKITLQNAELKKQQIFRNLLLKELNHRIKNNFQQISSILKLEMSNTDKNEIKEILNKTRNRIYALSIVYQKLYTENFNENTNFKEYTFELIGYISESLGISKKVFVVEIQPIKIKMQDSINLGLILNELIINSIKHSEVKKENLIIQLSVSINKSGSLLMRVIDNGAGFQSSLSEHSKIGLRLINLLLQKNDGSISFSNCNGACAEVIYPLNNEI